MDQTAVNDKESKKMAGRQDLRIEVGNGKMIGKNGFILGK